MHGMCLFILILPDGKLYINYDEKRERENNFTCMFRARMGSLDEVFVRSIKCLALHVAMMMMMMHSVGVELWSRSNADKSM